MFTDIQNGDFAVSRKIQSSLEQFPVGDTVVLEEYRGFQRSTVVPGNTGIPGRQSVHRDRVPKGYRKTVFTEQFQQYSAPRTEFRL